jgi:hypothetical protein
VCFEESGGGLLPSVTQKTLSFNEIVQPDCSALSFSWEAGF